MTKNKNKSLTAKKTLKTYFYEKNKNKKTFVTTMRLFSRPS